MGCRAAGACHVIQDGSHRGRHLGFYLELERIKKRHKLKFFIIDI